MTSWRDQAPDLRVADVDRDAAAAALGDHFEAGRLTADELEDRLGRALTARTSRDLTGLFDDLPAPVRQPGAAERAGLDRWRRRGRAAWPAVAGAVLVVAVLSAFIFGPHQGGHGGWAPWWIIPVIFFLVRRARRIGHDPAGIERADPAGRRAG